VKSLEYAKRSKRRAKPINRIMDAADQIRKDQEMVISVVTSIVEKDQMCTYSRGGGSI
jgi:hypothetical protein